MLDYAATLGTQRAGQRSWIVRLLRAILRPVAARDPRVLLFGLWLFLFAALSLFPRPFFLGRPPFLVPLLLRRSLRLGTLHSFRLGSFRPYRFRPHSFLRDGLRRGWALHPLPLLLPGWLGAGGPVGRVPGGWGRGGPGGPGRGARGGPAAPGAA